MTTEWTDLPTLQDVAKAQADGWEIEFKSGKEWTLWTGKGWYADQTYRARPRQPKRKKVKMLCWLDSDQELRWIREGDAYIGSNWVRVEEQDFEIEIPEVT